MSFAHCADMVAQGDPERFALVRGAGPEAARRLVALYALNLEIAKAAWASAEPMVAEMRLQWWYDAFEDVRAGKPFRSHPVLSELEFLRGNEAALVRVQGMIEARRWDIWRDTFADDAALWAHLEATGGALMGLSAGALGAGEGAALRAYGRAVALAQWLRALPQMQASGLNPLPAGDPEAVIVRLAEQGLADLRAARQGRAEVAKSAGAALLVGYEAGAILHQARQTPSAALQGALGISEFRRRGLLAWGALSGRW